MSLNSLTAKNINYLQGQFPSSTVAILKEHLKDAYIFVLIYLPQEDSRKKYRRLLYQIKDPMYITVYWYKNPLNMQPNEIPYIIKREHRKFVTLWFDLLIQLENSPFVISAFQFISNRLKYKKHTRFIAVHQDYLMVEDHKIPMQFNLSVNLFL